MKKLFLAIVLVGLFLPIISFAAGTYTIIDTTPDPDRTYTITYDGFVPCGRCCTTTPQAEASVAGECGQALAPGVPVPIGSLVPKKWVHCTICHGFVMIDAILDFILLKFIPPLAVLIFIITGIILYQAGSNPEKTKLARTIIVSVSIGLLLIYGGWMIINSVLISIGVADWTGLADDPATPQKEGWFQIRCEIETNLYTPPSAP